MNRFLALLLVACTPPVCETCPQEPARVSVDVCVDDAFSTADRLAIWRAADRWTRAFCGLVTIDPRIVEDGDTRGCERSIVMVYSTFEWVWAKVPCDSQSCAAGFTNESRDTANIIRDLVPEGALEAVVAHELGHLMSVDHGEELMDPYLTDSCIDRRAIVQAGLGIKR